MTKAESATAPSAEGAVARLQSGTAAARRRLAELVEVSLDRVFDAPLDIANPAEALAVLAPQEQGGPAPAAVRRAAEWGVARAAGRVSVRYGAKAAGRVAVPVTAAVEFGLAARNGIRELQVLASFLVGRLRRGGYPVTPELVRRTTLAVYLAPTGRLDLRVVLRRRSLQVARRWLTDSLPLSGRRQVARTRSRVERLASLDLDELCAEWARVNALEVGLAPPRSLPPR